MKEKGHASSVVVELSSVCEPDFNREPLLILEGAASFNQVPMRQVEDAITRKLLRVVEEHGKRCVWESDWDDYLAMRINPRGPGWLHRTRSRVRRIAESIFPGRLLRDPEDRDDARPAIGRMGV